MGRVNWVITNKSSHEVRCLPSWRVEPEANLIVIFYGRKSVVLFSFQVIMHLSWFNNIFFVLFYSDCDGPKKFF